MAGAEMPGTVDVAPASRAAAPAPLAEAPVVSGTAPAAPSGDRRITPPAGIGLPGEPAQPHIEVVGRRRRPAISEYTPSPAQAARMAAHENRPAADDIFAPSDEDRSPLAWIARMTGRPLPAATAPPESTEAPAPVLADDTPDPVAALPSTEEVAEPVAAIEQSGLEAATVPPPPVAVPAPARATVPPDRDNPPAPAAPGAAALGAMTPLPLAQATRRFLQPLIGLDPATVPIYRDAAAGQVAAAAGAEGLAIGEAVVLGAGHASDTPETVGLLAHELTHVVRLRQPRFVPPIARDAGRQGAAPSDDEPLARRVEARVIRAASVPLAPLAAQGSALQVPDGRSTGNIDRARLFSTEESPAALVASPSDAASPGGSGSWDGLPAPWEALPAWMETPSGGGPAFWPGAGAQALPASPAAPAAFAGAGAAFDAPAVQRAEPGRTLGDAESATPAHGPAGQGASSPIEPDLDALAQQVYAILRRRLASEHRRSG